MLDLNQKKSLLQLARNTIQKYLVTNKMPEINLDNLDPVLTENRATFVTLTKNGDLRGCIGSLVPHRPLAQDVAGNAVNAAIGDPRFPPLTSDELPEIKIEISVLSIPQKLEYSDSEDLLNKLQPNQDGVILSDGSASATYLPQVWEQLSDKKEFLSSLCVKAGLPLDAWKKRKMEIKTYGVEKFEEK